jgi:hypothetical protein
MLNKAIDELEHVWQQRTAHQSMEARKDFNLLNKQKLLFQQKDFPEII